MRVYIVILHFGNLVTTLSCIATLYKNETYPFSLLVVNNNAETYAAKDFSKKKITVLNNKKNLGFAKGVNIGIRYALQHGADAVCLLNNDTTITKPILPILTKDIMSLNTGIAGPAIKFKKNNKQLYDIGGIVQIPFYRTKHTEVEKIQKVKTRIVSYVSGCCMLIRKEVFKKVGLFDESFFLYYEDADFCLRAKKNGFVTILDSSIYIQHELSASAGKMSSFAIYHLLKSSIIFGKKYAVNLAQKIANRLFILFQAMLFLKANPRAAGVIGRVLLE